MPVLHWTDVSPLDIEAMLTSPEGRHELCEIRDQPDSGFEVRFVPPEVGVNILSIKEKGAHLPGMTTLLNCWLHRF